MFIMYIIHALLLVFCSRVHIQHFELHLDFFPPSFRVSHSVESDKLTCSSGTQTRRTGRVRNPRKEEINDLLNFIRAGNMSMKDFSCKAILLHSSYTSLSLPICVIFLPTSLSILINCPNLREGEKCRTLLRLPLPFMCMRI